jgi:D-ribose pyranase
VDEMKKGRLLHAELSHVIARLGHTDTLTIADAGLPVPHGPRRIDLALTPGTPGFLQVVEVVTQEMQVESALIAEEIKEHNPQLHSQLLAVLEALQQHQGNSITVRYISHEQFKQQTQCSQAVIRSGECSPYANVILSAGVTF